MTQDNLKWWQSAVFYQIYPRSFADGNGDGIGDFRGMLEKLDYLQSLGIEGIWLSPHFPSPQFDCGYDIADYTGVAPEYGTLDDFQRFLEGAHRRGMKVILDLVLNHTSDQHPWFQESRSSRSHPKRDWYIWRDGKNGGPPNNWNSTFGGPAWEYDQATGQYYYHFFFKEQPDLNWRNPEVKQAMFNAARFWLDRGVDGFRLDAIGTIFEDPELPDHAVKMTLAELRQKAGGDASLEGSAEVTELFKAMFQYQVEQPGMHALMQELRAVVDEYPGDRLLVGENDMLSYHGDGGNELHIVFNFPLMRTPQLTPAWVRANQQERLAALAAISPECWACNTLGNHDSPRLYGNFGGDGRRDERARLHLALMLTLKGTPFLYNGEEIGMSDLMLNDVSQFCDLLGTWLYRVEIEELGLSPAEALKHASELTRDKCRTPLQWRDTPHAGFCPPEVAPWLPVNPNYVQGVNVASQEKDPASLLNFYRRMIHFRRQTPTLIAGDYQPLLEDNPAVLAFLRSTEQQTCLVALNFSDQTQRVSLDLPGPLRTLFASPEPHAATHTPGDLELAPFAIYIGEIGGV